MANDNKQDALMDNKLDAPMEDNATIIGEAMSTTTPIPSTMTSKEANQLLSCGATLLDVMDGTTTYTAGQQGKNESTQPQSTASDIPPVYKIME